MSQSHSKELAKQGKDKLTRYNVTTSGGKKTKDADASLLKTTDVTGQGPTKMDGDVSKQIEDADTKNKDKVDESVMQSSFFTAKKSYLSMIDHWGTTKRKANVYSRIGIDENHGLHPH